MQIRIAAVLGVLFVIPGCRVIEPDPPPTAPRIGSFTASKTRISPGEQVVLSFSTIGATRVEVTDDSGNAIQLAGAVDEGTARVAPTRTSFYVLRATGAGGRDTAFVQIAVNEPLQELFLIAVPAAINSGETGQLLWGAPGATTVTLKTGTAAPTRLTGTTGSVVVTPAATEQYTLTAQGVPGTPPLTAIAEIQVRPVLKTATVDAPTGVKAGQTLTFAWTTAGATRVIVSETFGQLTNVTDSASVVNGTFDYVVPATLPNGIDVVDGLPLRFVISATNGVITVTQTLNVVVGELPVIERLVAPDFASAGRTFDVSWETLDATQITITVGGLPVFQTLAGAQARVDQGSVALPAPTSMTEYTLVASNDRGGTARRVFSVRPVALPSITTFTLTPVLTALGDPATAQWTTANAVQVVLRIENGATLAVVTVPSRVASGNSVLTPATSTRVVLEAYNAAGALVSEVRAVTLNASAVTINPTPVLRGADAGLSWTLAPAGVLETVGLATAAVTPIPNSPNFIDLATAAGAQELIIADPTNGSARLTPPPGFQFPFLGQVRPQLHVSVDGFIAFAAPGPLNTNVNFTVTTNTAPSMLAVFWDDLTMGLTSKIFFLMQTSPSGERYLVVQWNKLQLAGNANSELTFQAHLYETGQVAFIYKTLTGPVDSATVGVKDTLWPLAQQYVFNNATSVTTDLELNFFTSGPADGMLSFTAGAPRQITFFGRTATGLVPASAQLRSFGPGDLTVNEAMPFPEPTVSALGKWIELKNNADASVDFDGLRIDSLGSTDGGGYLIPPGTVVPPLGFLVLGQSTNLLDTGGAPVTQVMTDLPLGPVDRVRVQLQGTVLSQLTWDAGVPGTSTLPSSSVMVAAGSTFSCSRTATFGPAGALGTPGAANEKCAPYVLTSIAGGFLPAPTGSEILGTISPDDGHGTATLAVPFTYFGTPFTTFSLSTNGFITFGGALTTTNDINDTVVARGEPDGVLAIFWDDLYRDTGARNAMWRLTDRTIITWENWQLFNTFPPGSTLNMQIHLLDNGAIEFHYGAIATNSTDPNDIADMTGASATIWIERPDGAIAIPYAINRLNSVVPNSGLRFTPVP